MYIEQKHMELLFLKKSIIKYGENKWEDQKEVKIKRHF